MTAEPPCSPAMIASKTTAARMAPIGSISDASQASTCRTRSAGRTRRSSGLTTIGPETTKMTPVMTAAAPDIPSSSAAAKLPRIQVSAAPIVVIRTAIRRTGPVSSRRSRPRASS
jgi:hypothetical protein